jgi:outer membrane receptor protein involved in Fe transport
MERKGYFLAILATLFALSVFGQGGTGTLKATVKNADNGETLPFVPVLLEQGGVQVRSGQTDINGVVEIKPINPGQYDVIAKFIGFGPVKISGVIISGGKLTELDLQLKPTSQDLPVVEIVYEPPLIDDYVGTTKTRQEIVNLPTRNINSVAATTAGVTQGDEGDGINVRGSREDATFYFIDGVKVRGSINIPQQGIEQIQVITGGVPAMYGDLTGGVISITTRGPSTKHVGGVEYATSELFDKYGYNLLGLNATGPILSKKMADGSRRAVLGYFLASEFLSQRDPDPSAIGNFRVKKDVLDQIQQNPLRPGPLGSGTVQNAEYLGPDAFEKISYKPNTAARRASVTAKIDIKPSSSTSITFGGQFDYFNRNLYSYTNSLFNTDNNGQRIDYTYRGYAKFTQQLGRDDDGNDDGSASAIKNVFYTLQVDYTRNSAVQQSSQHQDRVFDYGYMGKFETFKTPIYEIGVDTINGQLLPAFYQTGFRDTLYSFQRSDVNPVPSNYTQRYYDLNAGLVQGNYENFFQVQQGGGLLNGGQVDNVYSLFWNTGFIFNGFSKFDNSQFRAVANASADIKGHELALGFEYEQRTDRSYGLSPVGLWGLMRQLVNSHIDQLDLANPQPVYVNGVFQDTVKYDRLYTADAQRFFDKSLREKLGLPVNGTDWIGTDALDRSTYSLDMFSPDELFNGGGGSSLVAYNGYDHTGRLIRGNPTFDDFLNKKDANGNFTREIGAFQPIYIAGYIQDKFAFRDIIFNIGVRVDRYDANQLVLKDPYVLYETRTAGELSIPDRPSNIGDDYVVYVRDVNNPSTANIIGYRNGNTFYDAAGTELQDAQVLSQTTTNGKIAPYLLDPANQRLSSNAFRDYTPQVNIMPRIAFQFPISDDAQFFAHYDVLTQRPTAGNRFDPLDYLFLQTNIGNTLNNPDLQPQRTTDYELGFKQKLNDRSALTLTAFYRELRNLVQQQAVLYAYPVNYTTFGNVDFGTVKGFTAAYDLRRTGNVRLTANYTLQFADGTGSNTSFAAGLIQAGLGNLRTPIPLSFDTRHQIQLTFDYRWGHGDEYNGPKGWLKNIFQDLGANFVVLANSGAPYSQQSNFTQDGAFGINDRAQLKGSINGSRLPWQFRVNVRVDKNIELRWGKKDAEGKRAKSSSYLNIYLLCQNLLNTKNIIGVYRATGNADDDGFLTAATSQGIINGKNDPQSFINMYQMKINNPANFSLPRQLRLGAILNF